MHTKYVRLVTTRLTRILTDCGFTHYPDITATKVQAYLADLRRDTPQRQGLSIQRHNFYLTAIKQFCRWMMRHGRASTNPVDHLAPLNVRLDRRHDRRALSVDEARKLLTTTAASAPRGGMTMTGPERRLLCWLALETGLRANELRSLTKSSFNLDAATVTVTAAYSKRRRTDTLPPRPALVEALRTHLTGKAPDAPTFHLPHPVYLTKVFRADLEAAGLPYRDTDGCVADFHCLRHTFITNLVRSGVHPRVAQALARHSTITLTMDRYAHTLLGEQAEALRALPDLASLTSDSRARAVRADLCDT